MTSVKEPIDWILVIDKLAECRVMPDNNGRMEARTLLDNFAEYVKSDDNKLFVILSEAANELIADAKVDALKRGVEIDASLLDPVYPILRKLQAELYRHSAELRKVHGSMSQSDWLNECDRRDFSALLHIGEVYLRDNRNAKAYVSHLKQHWEGMCSKELCSSISNTRRHLPDGWLKDTFVSITANQLS